MINYLDRRRRETPDLPDYKIVETYLHQKNILGEFVNYAAQQGVARNDRDLQISGKYVENEVVAYIARNILNDYSVFLIIRNQMDNIVQKGVATITNY